MKKLQLTVREATVVIKKHLKQAQDAKKLPRLLYMPWINEKLLDPQNLLLFGKRKLKKLKLSKLGINITNNFSSVRTHNHESTLTLRMANIRSLTREKLQIDRAMESLTNATPDVYVYVESRHKPVDNNLQKYRQVFHSTMEEGRGGTTILVNKKMSINFSETNIPDTVLLVLQKAQSTVILAVLEIQKKKLAATRTHFW